MSKLPNNLEKLTKKELIDIINQLNEKTDSPSEFFRTCFLADIKQRVGNPYPVSSPMGMMGVKRSIIPKEQAERVVFHLDKDTSTRVASLAFEQRITGDEFIRQLLWTYTSIYR